VLIGVTVYSLYRARADHRLYSLVAVTAEELGFDSFWMGHHLVFAPTISATYPYAADGVSPHASDMDRLDPFVLFSHLAAQTTRLRFGSGIYLLPLVNPFVTAKAVSTADVLSNGRIICGIGVGWNEEEYDIVGEDFASRGRRTDEIIEILQQLWTQETAEFHGEHYDFGPAHFSPKPRQRPHPPLVYGGLSPAALARAARLDGSYLLVRSVNQVEAALAEIDRIRRSTPASAAPFDVTVQFTGASSPADLGRLADVGVDRVLFDVGVAPFDPDSPIELTESAIVANMERLAEMVSVTA
jgi:probable F420-dependent oxidoreductase